MDYLEDFDEINPEQREYYDALYAQWEEVYAQCELLKFAQHLTLSHHTLDQTDGSLAQDRLKELEQRLDPETFKEAMKKDNFNDDLMDIRFKCNEEVRRREKLEDLGHHKITYKQVKSLEPNERAYYDALQAKFKAVSDRYEVFSRGQRLIAQGQVLDDPTAIGNLEVGVISSQDVYNEKIPAFNDIDEFIKQVKPENQANAVLPEMRDYEADRLKIEQETIKIQSDTQALLTLNESQKQKNETELQRARDGRYSQKDIEQVLQGPKKEYYIAKLERLDVLRDQQIRYHAVEQAYKKEGRSLDSIGVDSVALDNEITQIETEVLPSIYEKAVVPTQESIDKLKRSNQEDSKLNVSLGYMARKEITRDDIEGLKSTLKDEQIAYIEVHLNLKATLEKKLETFKKAKSEGRWPAGQEPTNMLSIQKEIREVSRKLEPRSFMADFEKGLSPVIETTQKAILENGAQVIITEILEKENPEPPKEKPEGMSVEQFKYVFALLTKKELLCQKRDRMDSAIGLMVKFGKDDSGSYKDLEKQRKLIDREIGRIDQELHSGKFLENSANLQAVEKSVKEEKAKLKDLEDRYQDLPKIKPKDEGPGLREKSQAKEDEYRSAIEQEYGPLKLGESEKLEEYREHAHKIQNFDMASGTPAELEELFDKERELRADAPEGSALAAHIKTDAAMIYTYSKVQIEQERKQAQDNVEHANLNLVKAQGKDDGSPESINRIDMATAKLETAQLGLDTANDYSAMEQRCASEVNAMIAIPFKPVAPEVNTDKVQGELDELNVEQQELQARLGSNIEKLKQLEKPHKNAVLKLKNLNIARVALKNAEKDLVKANAHLDKVSSSKIPGRIKAAKAAISVAQASVKFEKWCVKRKQKKYTKEGQSIEKQLEKIKEERSALNEDSAKCENKIDNLGTEARLKEIQRDRQIAQNRLATAKVNQNELTERVHDCMDERGSLKKGSQEYKAITKDLNTLRIDLHDANEEVNDLEGNIAGLDAEEESLEASQKKKLDAANDDEFSKKKNNLDRQIANLKNKIANKTKSNLGVDTPDKYKKHSEAWMKRMKGFMKPKDSFDQAFADAILAIIEAIMGAGRYARRGRKNIRAVLTLIMDMKQELAELEKQRAALDKKEEAAPDTPESDLQINEAELESVKQSKEELETLKKLPDEIVELNEQVEAKVKEVKEAKAELEVYDESVRNQGSEPTEDQQNRHIELSENIDRLDGEMQALQFKQDKALNTQKELNTKHKDLLAKHDNDIDKALGDVHKQDVQLQHEGNKLRLDQNSVTQKDLEKMKKLESAVKADPNLQAEYDVLKEKHKDLLEKNGNDLETANEALVSEQQKMEQEGLPIALEANSINLEEHQNEVESLQQKQEELEANSPDEPIVLVDLDLAKAKVSECEVVDKQLHLQEQQFEVQAKLESLNSDPVANKAEIESLTADQGDLIKQNEWALQEVETAQMTSEHAQVVSDVAHLGKNLAEAEKLSSVLDDGQKEKVKEMQAELAEKKPLIQELADSLKSALFKKRRNDVDGLQLKLSKVEVDTPEADSVNADLALAKALVSQDDLSLRQGDLKEQQAELQEKLVNLNLDKESNKEEIDDLELEQAKLSDRSNKVDQQLEYVGANKVHAKVVSESAHLKQDVANLQNLGVRTQEQESELKIKQDQIAAKEPKIKQLAKALDSLRAKLFGSKDKLMPNAPKKRERSQSLGGNEPGLERLSQLSEEFSVLHAQDKADKAELRPLVRERSNSASPSPVIPGFEQQKSQLANKQNSLFKNPFSTKPKQPDDQPKTTPRRNSI